MIFMVDMQVQLPVTSETVEQAYCQVYAPWMKAMGLYEIQISKRKASAILPQSTSLQ